MFKIADSGEYLCELIFFEKCKVILDNKISGSLKVEVNRLLNQIESSLWHLLLQDRLIRTLKKEVKQLMEVGFYNLNLDFSFVDSIYDLILWTGLYNLNFGLFTLTFLLLTTFIIWSCEQESVAKKTVHEESSNVSALCR